VETPQKNGVPDGGKDPLEFKKFLIDKVNKMAGKDPTEPRNQVERLRNEVKDKLEEAKKKDADFDAATQAKRLRDQAEHLEAQAKVEKARKEAEEKAEAARKKADLEKAKREAKAKEEEAKKQAQKLETRGLEKVNQAVNKLTVVARKTIETAQKKKAEANANLNVAEAKTDDAREAVTNAKIAGASEETIAKLQQKVEVAKADKIAAKLKVEEADSKVKLTEAKVDADKQQLKATLTAKITAAKKKLAVKQVTGTKEDIRETANELKKAIKEEISKEAAKETKKVVIENADEPSTESGSVVMGKEHAENLMELIKKLWKFGGQQYLDEARKANPEKFKELKARMDAEGIKFPDSEE